MATTTKCKKCGCEDSFLISPAPCPTPEGCPDPEPCSEVFDAQCVKYTGPNILCDQDVVIATNDTVSDALANIVDQFCVQDSYVEDVELQGNNLVFTGLGLAFDGSVDLSSIIPSIDADNGLNISSGGSVLLGGTLIQNTTITTVDFDFNLIGARVSNAEQILFVQNTGQGGAIVALSIANSAVTGASTNSVGGFFTSQVSNAVVAISSTFNFAAINASNVALLANGTAIGLSLTTQTTSPLPAAGIANKIQFSLSHDDSGTNVLTDSNEIISTFTDVLSASLTSELIFRGRSGGGAMTDLVTFKGDGEVRFHEYGVGNFVNAPAYMLGVDASGNVVEVALP
jgi:hypothetical protein